LELLLLPVLLVVLAIVLPVAALARRRQLARLALLAPDAYIFTFTSNSTYQGAILELQRQEIIDPTALGDDSRPLTRGPRWVSATPQGIRIMRGYDSDPVVELPWAMIGDISSERVIRRGTRSESSIAVAITVHGPGGDIPVILFSPAGEGFFTGPLKQARAVAARLHSIRTSPPAARPV
jgi:hypothetical protein